MACEDRGMSRFSNTGGQKITLATNLGGFQASDCGG
jgi:hypothetical protein